MPHQGRCWPMCPGAWCEITGLMRMAGVKETCLGLREDLPLESRLWVLLPGDEGMGRELEAGVRAMGGGGDDCWGVQGTKAWEEGI